MSNRLTREVVRGNRLPISPVKAILARSDSSPRRNSERPTMKETSSPDDVSVHDSPSRRRIPCGATKRDMELGSASGDSPLYCANVCGRSVPPPRERRVWSSRSAMKTISPKASWPHSADISHRDGWSRGSRIHQWPVASSLFGYAPRPKPLFKFTARRIAYRRTSCGLHSVPRDPVGPPRAMPCRCRLSVSSLQSDSDRV